MDTLYIVMPAYNEEENIASVVEKWYPLLGGKSERSRLVIADSGSTDRTHAILTELSGSRPQLVVLGDIGKEHGPKVLALYRYAIKAGADYVFQTDSDDQTDPRDFGKFWKRRRAYDAVIGYRRVRGDGKARAFVETVVCRLLRLFFGIRVPDANAPFRLMRTSLLAKYIGRMPVDYELPNIMFTTFFVYYGEKVAFQEVSFGARHGGTSWVNVPRIVRTGCAAMQDFARFKKEM